MYFWYHDFKQKSSHRTHSWTKQGKNLPKNCWKSQIFLSTPIYNAIILTLLNLSTYFCFSEKFAPKLPKFANIHIYNAIIQIVNISIYFWIFFEKAYLGTMISSQKVVHRTNSWSEWAKNLAKTCQRTCIFLIKMK